MANYLYFILLFLATVLINYSEAQQYTTPVPILKQINKHNEDGSYSYGYEAADGTFKIETKYPNGEVFGKYGYYDDTGKLREVEYGASRRGFEPAGSEIQVPPPTLKQNADAQRPLGPNEEDDGQYREDPSVYYKNDPYYQPAPVRNTAAYQPAPRVQNNYYQPTPAPVPFRPQPNYFSQPRYYNNPAPPAYPNYNAFQGHPASNVDIFSGSYSVNYRR